MLSRLPSFRKRKGLLPDPNTDMKPDDMLSVEEVMGPVHIRDDA